MEIHVDAQGRARLREPHDFRKFKTVAGFDSGRADLIEAAFGAAAAMDADGHLWISADWLRSASGEAGSSEWNEGFEKMLAFAGKHGWVRDGSPTFVRSHLEWMPRV